MRRLLSCSGHDPESQGASPSMRVPLLQDEKNQNHWRERRGIVDHRCFPLAILWGCVVMMTLQGSHKLEAMKCRILGCSRFNMLLFDELFKGGILLWLFVWRIKKPGCNIDSGYLLGRFGNSRTRKLRSFKEKRLLPGICSYPTCSSLGWCPPFVLSNLFISPKVLSSFVLASS